MSKPTIRVITFDLDDTFWNAKPTLIDAEHRVFNWLTCYAPKVTDRFTLKNLTQWRSNFYKNTPELAHQISQLRLIAMQQVMTSVGYSQALANQLAKEAFEVFIDARHNVTLFDGVITMLEQLSHRYVLGTLTNGNADINRLPIAKYFAFSYRAEQLNASKPSPELFLAAQQAHPCQADQLIHVGDHIEHDVFGARQAGCHALWYNPEAQIAPDPSLVSVEVQSLAEIPLAIQAFEQTLRTKPLEK